MRLVISGRRTTYRAPSAMLPKIEPAAAPVGLQPRHPDERQDDDQQGVRHGVHRVHEARVR